MTFDSNWENKIYKEKKQINKFPFDWVVSTVNRLFSSLDPAASLNVLELGCGTGNNLKFFLDFGFENIHGIDGSNSALQRAEEYLGASTNKVKLIASDFGSISEGDDYYDLILDRGSVTHNDFESCRDIFSEVFRVLKPGGYVISAMFSNSHSALHAADSISHSFYRAFHSESDNRNGLNTSFFSIQDVFDLFAPFKIVSCIHNVSEEMIGNPLRSTMWHVVAQKPVE
jgi:ubiquinone/menaquinone biosynthesis C-methylase UbiE